MLDFFVKIKKLYGVLKLKANLNRILKLKKRHLL